MEKMRFFSYDEASLSEEQKAKIIKIKEDTASTLKRLDEQERGRMERKPPIPPSRNGLRLRKITSLQLKRRFLSKG